MLRTLILMAVILLGLGAASSSDSQNGGGAVAPQQCAIRQPVETEATKLNPLTRLRATAVREQWTSSLKAPVAPQLSLVKLFSSLRTAVGLTGPANGSVNANDKTVAGRWLERKLDQ